MILARNVIWNLLQFAFLLFCFFLSWEENVDFIDVVFLLDEHRSMIFFDDVMNTFDAKTMILGIFFAGLGKTVLEYTRYIKHLHTTDK